MTETKQTQDITSWKLHPIKQYKTKSTQIQQTNFLTMISIVSKCIHKIWESH